MNRVLILGGTAEAVALAQALHDADGEWDIITSLAGVTRNPVTGPGRLRQGGFGGISGLAHYLEQEAVDRLVDATHPFAAAMASHAVQAARQAGVAHIKLVRPMWQRQAADQWHEVDTSGQAAETLHAHNAASVFLTLGRRDLEAFANLHETHFVLRMIEPPPEPLPLADAELILARGPFTAGDEEALMRQHHSDALVTKASGGKATEAKIVAARRLGLPVIMIRRPGLPEGHCVWTLDAVLAWLQETVLENPAGA